MILLLSPAKSLDTTPIDFKKNTQPVFLEESVELVTKLKRQTAEDLKKLMNVSDKIADLNVVRFRSFSPPFTPTNAKQALFMFTGDVYKGMDIANLDEAALDFAQKHVRILSGLYGVLRPFDLIQAYRLEMGTRFATDKGKDLYAFWGDKITHQINSDLEASGTPYIINLASNEYFKSINKKQLKGTLLQIDFKELRDGKYKIIAFNAKRARGMMTHYIAQNAITSPDDLKGFDMAGYHFNEDLSSKNHLVFTRETT